MGGQADGGCAASLVDHHSGEQPRNWGSDRFGAAATLCGLTATVVSGYLSLVGCLIAFLLWKRNH